VKVVRPIVLSGFLPGTLLRDFRLPVSVTNLPSHPGSAHVTDRRTDRHRVVAYIALCVSVAYASTAFRFAG